MQSNTFVIQSCSAEEYAQALAVLESQLTGSVSFLQAPLYGRLQEAAGKTVVYTVVHSKDSLVACGLAVAYTAPGGLAFLYLPYGPVASQWSTALYESFREYFAVVARQSSYAFVRLDVDGLATLPSVQMAPLSVARMASLQPRSEWVLDIAPHEDDLWATLHKHARYNVRLADRAQANTKIYRPSEAPIDDFYRLMQTTAERDTFGIFDKSYYKAYFDSMTDEDGFVVVCYIDTVPAAAALFVLHDEQAHYVFAGSSNDFRKIAPAYEVIWAAIKESKKRGARLFNFGGVTDAVKGHDLGGVTSFKRRFGGYQVDHNRPVDIVYDHLRYNLFRLYKTLR